MFTHKLSIVFNGKKKLLSFPFHSPFPLLFFFKPDPFKEPSTSVSECVACFSLAWLRVVCKKFILTLFSYFCRLEYYISQNGSKQQQAILEGVCSAFSKNFVYQVITPK